MTPLRKAKRRTEAVLERKCVAKARGAGVLVSKLTDPTGAPDRCFWLPGGRPLLVEFKDPAGKATELQQKYQEMFRAAGYDVAVVRTQEEFEEAVGHGD